MQPDWPLGTSAWTAANRTLQGADTVATARHEVDVTDRERSVLLVEDDGDHRQLLQDSLHRSGRYRVVGHTDSAAGAVEQAHALSPNVILMDLQLRASTGQQSIPHLLEIVPRAMIVAVSGQREGRARESALAAGAFAFLPKHPDLYRGSVLPDLLARLDTQFERVLSGEEAYAPVMLPLPGDRMSTASDMAGGRCSNP